MRFRKRPVQFSEAPDSQRPQELGQVGNDSKENGNQRSQAPHGSGILPDKQLNGNGRQALTAVSAIEQNRAVSVSCKLLMTFAQHKESRQLSLGDIPVLRGEEVFDAMKELRYEQEPPDGGELLLASVDRVIVVQTKRKQAAKKSCAVSGDLRA